MTRIDTFSCLGLLEVMHKTTLTDDPGSIPRSDKYCYVAFFVWLMLHLLVCMQNPLFVMKCCHFLYNAISSSVLKWTPLRSGRVTHLKRLFLKICFFFSNWVAKSIKEILSYHKIRFDTLNTLVKRKYRFPKSLWPIIKLSKYRYDIFKSCKICSLCKFNNCQFRLATKGTPVSS